MNMRAFVVRWAAMALFQKVYKVKIGTINN